MKIKVIVTGSTGMVGEGVLHECLLNDDVEKVLVINRKPCGVQHIKLTEIIHNNFFDLSTIAPQLSGYDACFFCLGVSSIGKNEKDYTHFTYDLTMHVAQKLSTINHNMIFCYVSGAGTDSSQRGRLMWARVKGKTENDLVKLSFKKVYNFRPAFIQPTKGLRNTLKAYTYFKWAFPAFRFLFPGYVCTLEEIGLAMIHAATKGYSKTVLEVKDIISLAKT